MKNFKSLFFFLLLFSFYSNISCDEKQKSKDSNSTEKIIDSGTSMFSKYKVIEKNSTRTLLFVRDNGDEVVESAVNITKKHDLVLEYTKLMYSSFLLKKTQEDCLLVGLGGGGMIQFANYYYPNMKLDVVEIDVTMEALARKHFMLVPNQNTTIYIEDGYDFISNSNKKYDVIYMDAFLKPSFETDETGVSKKLKGFNFYTTLKKRLKPDGIVVFNLNYSSTLHEDIKRIRDSFESTYIFKSKRSGNYIVVSNTTKTKLTKQELLQNAKQLDKELQSFYEYIANTLVE